MHSDEVKLRAAIMTSEGVPRRRTASNRFLCRICDGDELPCVDDEESALPAILVAFPQLALDVLLRPMVAHYAVDVPLRARIRLAPEH
jgi:hypothetical protein